MQDLDIDPGDGQEHPVGEFRVRFAVLVHRLPQRALGGMQENGGAGRPGEIGRGADVVVVPVGADDRGDTAPGDGGSDRPRVVRRVDDQDLLVVADQPHVVVDVERLAVQAERA